MYTSPLCTPPYLGTFKTCTRIKDSFMGIMDERKSGGLTSLLIRCHLLLAFKLVKGGHLESLVNIMWVINYDVLFDN